MGLMDKQACLEAFLSDIHPDFAGAVTCIHDALVEQGCVVKLQEAKNGHVVSYLHPADGKALANFVSRKTGPVIRIYGDGIGAYSQLLESLPDKLEQKLVKASACRRMLDPTKCNSRCAMGYDFVLRGTRHQKCRFNCFLFPVNGEYLPFLLAFVERECGQRAG